MKFSQLNYLAATCLLATLLCGCQAPAQKGMAIAPPASTDRIEQLRSSYREQNPKVQLGVVADVLPAESLAAVSDVDLTKFHVGDTVCFMDSTAAPLVCGSVVRITDAQLHVKYETPAPDRRIPVRGDLAVAFK